MSPSVSVCVPTFNGSAHLEECLRSVITQTFRDIEVIVVDDGSSDASVDIALQLAREDGRIRVEAGLGNVGMVRNWNRSAMLARSDWIKFVFQDDLLYPHCIERLLASASLKTPFVACDREIVIEDASGPDVSALLDHLERNRIDRLFPGTTLVEPYAFSRFVVEGGGNFVGEPTAVLLHRQVFDRFGYFRSDIVHLCDWEYWIRVGSQVGLGYVAEPLATFRFHGANATNRLRRERRFAVDVIDPLKIGYSVAYGREYSRLRQEVGRAAVFRLRNDLAIRTRAARDAATSGTCPRTNAVAVHEWDLAVAANPELASLSTSFRARSFGIWRRARRRLGRLRRVYRRVRINRRGLASKGRHNDPSG